MKRRVSIFCTLALLVSAVVTGGCTSRSKAKATAQEAFLAGQNAALQQTPQFPTVTILGPVQNHVVPWVAGLTLVQAIATANYLDSHAPKTIAITRQGESATLKADVLLNGAVVPLEPGDVVELKN